MLQNKFLLKFEQFYMQTEDNGYHIFLEQPLDKVSDIGCAR